MALKQQIDKDIKDAMLSGDRTLVTTLRGLKNAILYAEVAAGKRDDGLSDAEIADVLLKEAKKRSESAELYDKGGSNDKARLELDEKIVIEKYLPDKLSDTEISDLIDQVEKQLGKISAQNMGATIAAVKQKAGAAADGAIIARLVKERIN